MEKTPQKQEVNLHTGVLELSLKVWRTIVLCTMICIVVVFALSSIMVRGVWGPLVTQAICIIISGLTIYSHLWGLGDRDANFIQFGRLERDKFKGVKICLLAIVPNLVLNIPLILSMTGVIPFDFLPFYRILQAPVWPLINVIHPYGAVAHAAIEATADMPAVPATAGLGWGQFAIIACLPLIYVICGTIGYELGVRRISLGFRLMYEDKNSPKKGKKKK